VSEAALVEGGSGGSVSMAAQRAAKKPGLEVPVRSFLGSRVQRAY